MHILMETIEDMVLEGRIWVSLGTMATAIIKVVQIHHDYIKTEYPHHTRLISCFFIITERKSKWIILHRYIKSNKKHELALTSSCRIAVSLSLISSRSCSVMATSSSWLCIWFHSSWLQGDKHSSWFLLSKVCLRQLQHLYCQQSLSEDITGSTSSGINQYKVPEGHNFHIQRQSVYNTKKTKSQISWARLRWSRIMRDGTPEVSLHFSFFFLTIFKVKSIKNRIPSQLASRLAE